MSENGESELEKSSQALKDNLRVWLNSLKMVSDTIDILDANILNIGIKFEVIAQQYANKSSLYGEIRQKLFEEFREIPPEIGQPFYITEVFKVLKQLDEVLDVVNVEIVNFSGGNYAGFSYQIDSGLSRDGRILYVPKDSIWEIKFITDISGVIK